MTSFIPPAQPAPPLPMSELEALLVLQKFSWQTDDPDSAKLRTARKILQALLDRTDHRTRYERAVETMQAEGVHVLAVLHADESDGVPCGTSPQRVVTALQSEFQHNKLLRRARADLEDVARRTLQAALSPARREKVHG